MLAGMDKRTKKNSLRFLFACYFLYLISICIKMVYSSEMAEIISSVGSDKPSVSLGLLFYYSAYFSAQLIFSFLISRINLKWFLSVTVSLTSLSFGMMLFASRLWHLYLILFLNGFLQVGIWGGVMYFVGRYIPLKMSGFASKLLATGLAIGTALTYGSSALFIAFGSWRYTFVFFSVLSLVSLGLFLVALHFASRNLSHVFAEKLQALKVEKNQFKESKSSLHSKKKSHGIVFTVAFFTIFTMFISCIYYAVMGWFPSLLIENFNMPTKYSILLTLLLPLFTTPSSFFTISFREKTNSDYTVLVLFLLSVVLLLCLLCFAFALNIVLTIVCTALVLFGLRGMMSLTGVYFPLRYSDKIESGKFSMILNAFSSLMAGIMPYTVSLVLEKTSWSVYFIILLAISATALVMIACGYISEKRR